MTAKRIYRLHGSVTYYVTTADDSHRYSTAKAAIKAAGEDHNNLVTAECRHARMHRVESYICINKAAVLAGKDSPVWIMSGIWEED